MKNSELRSQKNSIVGHCLCLVVGIVVGVVIGLFLGGIVSEKNENNVATDLEKVETVQQQEIGAEVEKKQEDKGTMEQMLQEPGFVIETPFVDLYYPEKWKEQVRIEQLAGEDYCVQFFAVVGEYDEIHIFDIEFGGEAGSVLGTINVKDDESIPVSVVAYDFEVDDQWNSDEINEVYGMLEDINYIIGMLLQEEEFVPIS